MIIVFPFCHLDEELALKNAQWIAELGGCKGHDCLLIHDPRCTSPNVIEAELRKSFDKGITLKAPAEIDGWPQGANYFFRLAASRLQDAKYPYFLWLEPDAIPLCEGWLDAIDNEFKTVAIPAKKVFMGDRVEVNEVPLHLSGVAIYPNPIHAYAGEAFRAHDVAWDISAKDQIVPKAHFTKLINHAWKHPQFTNENELETQIRPEAVLFHSSKDGSLIDLLRNKKNLSGGVESRHAGYRRESSNSTDLSEPEDRESASTRRPSSHPVEQLQGNSGSSAPPAQDFTCDIFIRTYPADYQWLKYCLQSINKFCTGFRKIWVVSPDDKPASSMTAMGYEWKIMNEETTDGYLAQQIHKLYADVITDYQADYILHVDSDVVFTRPTTPLDFMCFTPPTSDTKWHPAFGNPKPIWYYTPYSAIEVPWQPITEQFMVDKVDNEFMRRFPIIVPRWLYPRLREFCHRKSGGYIVSQYIANQPHRAFSEFNALGAYAWKFHRDKFHFVNTLETQMPEPFARQFHSWGGITPEIQAEIEKILGGHGVGGELQTGADFEPHETPAQSISTEKGGDALRTQQSETSLEVATRPSNAAPTVQSAGAATIPAGIKELPSGIWVIKDDTHISKWVEQQGRLDHDQNLLPFILPEIGANDVVVDAGAFIGDHTFAYLKAARDGIIYAFEPNPLAFRCLVHNLYHWRVIAIEAGLSDSTDRLAIGRTENNCGGFYLVDDGPNQRARVVPLDSYGLNPNFVKLDVEGFEYKALCGMEHTIKHCHPKLVIEINVEALARQYARPKMIFDFIERHGYRWKILQENCDVRSPMFDILAIPSTIERNGFDLKEHIREIADYGKQSRGNKIRLGQQLAKAGLK